MQQELITQPPFSTKIYFDELKERSKSRVSSSVMNFSEMLLLAILLSLFGTIFIEIYYLNSEAMRILGSLQNLITNIPLL